jgi:hypothetical protein
LIVRGSLNSWTGSTTERNLEESSNGRGQVKYLKLYWKGQALAAVAAYIELNPVRVGLYADSKDYCTISEVACR